MKLRRADKVSGLMGKLEADWSAEAEKHGGDFKDFAEPYIAHAKTIANEDITDLRYGIYVLDDDQGNFVLLAHFNLAALPSTSGFTLRVLWILLSPKYDYEDITTEELARITAGLITETVRLARVGLGGSQIARHIKIHLTGLPDKRYFEGALRGFRSPGDFERVAIRGNWAYITIRT